MYIYIYICIYIYTYTYCNIEKVNIEKKIGLIIDISLNSKTLRKLLKKTFLIN